MEKIIAVSDELIPQNAMAESLFPLKKLSDVEVTHWEHETVADLQADNIRVEQGGPAQVRLSPELQKKMAEATVLVVHFTPIDRELLIRATKLKAIFVLRAGLENVDLVTAAEKGIEVFNLTGRNARAVAEFTVGLMLAETKNIARSHQSLKAGDWRKDFVSEGQVIEFNHRQIGLVGFGKIGQLITELLTPFGCQFLIYDPYLTTIEATNAQLVSLEELLSQSDIVSIHARATPETYHLIGQSEFEMMKQGAYFINSARAHLVDEKALIQVLKSGHLMGAALDVFEQEPLPESHPLLALDNVTLTAHLAGTTLDAFGGSPRLMLPKIQGWLSKGEV